MTPTATSTQTPTQKKTLVDMNWDPITRIVGSLGIYTKIDFANREVAECYSTSSIFRGYSIFMKGKDPRDAHFITSPAAGVRSLTATCRSAAGWLASAAVRTSAGFVSAARCRDFPINLCRLWTSRPERRFLPPPSGSTVGRFANCAASPIRRSTKNRVGGIRARN